MKAEDILDPIAGVKGDYDGLIEYVDALRAVSEAYRLGANVALDAADSATWIHGTAIKSLHDTITLD